MQIEKWGVFELPLESSSCFDQPIRDVELGAVFVSAAGVKKVTGFYDGDSVWKIRYMPDCTGIHSYSVVSSNREFDGIQGRFECIAPQPGNHGPVNVTGKHHFIYADGTPFFAMGTTAYSWHNRPEGTRRKSLESFSQYGFNKVRMLFMPKYYVGEFADVEVSYEPPCYPFVGEPNHFDFQSPNPSYFRNFEDRVRELMEIGIQAEVIFFHVYDSGHWGIDSGMNEEDDLLFIRYLVARLAAFRNVWWSLANEFDLFFHLDNCKSKLKQSMDGWSILGEYTRMNDTCSHLLSVHNFIYGEVFPDREWLTHVSYQNANTYSMLLELKNKYNKPVIDDEYQYEGNVRDEWGNTSAELELFRHWQTAMAGGYGTHGEAFIIDGNHTDIFWAYGGKLVGESAPRLKYMKEILESCPFQQMQPDSTYADGNNSFGLNSVEGVSLYFYRKSIPGKRLRFELFEDKAVQFKTTVYDVWNCMVMAEEIVEPDHAFQMQDWMAIKLERLGLSGS